MAPTERSAAVDVLSRRQSSNYGLSEEGLVLEAWSLGFLLAGLIIMAGVTVANMGHRLLHRLILVELLLAMLRGTVILMTFEGRYWFHSSTGLLLYSSYYLHNVISWLKIKPFLSQRVSRLYIGTLLLVLPYWILETYANFTYFNAKHLKTPFLTTRSLEAAFRDPWWIFACVNLAYNIKKRYNFGLRELIRVCPRFGVMLVSMLLSIVFLIVDVAVTVAPLDGVNGINPFWKLSTVFKCFCDTIVLDDFKSALDKLRVSAFGSAKFGQYGSSSGQPARVGGLELGSLGGTPKSPVAAVSIESCEPERIGRDAASNPNTIYVSKTVTLEETKQNIDTSTGGSNKSPRGEPPLIRKSLSH